MAFQGRGLKLASFGGKIKNALGAAMLAGNLSMKSVAPKALMLGAAATTMVGCFHVEQKVTVEMDNMIAVLQQALSQMSADNQELRTLVSTLIKEIIKLRQQVEDGQATQEQANAAILAAILANGEYLQIIMEMTGLTLEEIQNLQQNNPSGLLEQIINLLTSINNAVGNIYNEIQQLRQDLSGRYDALLDKVGNIEQNIAAIKADVAGIKGDLQALLNKIDQMNAAINPLRNDINSNFAGVIYRLEANTAEVAGLKAIVEQGLQAHNMTLEQFIALYNQNESAARNLLLQILDEQQAQNQHEAEQTSWLINIYGAIQNLPDDVFERIVPPIVNAINGLGNDMNLNLGEISGLLGQLVEFARNHHNHPDYDAKLDRIIELLQQYLNSDDEGQNEGVRNELEDIFNGMSK